MQHLAAFDVVRALKTAAAEAFPHEYAALILKDGEIIELRNLSKTPGDSHVIDPLVWIKYERNTIAVFHTHPGGPPRLSRTDMEFGLKVNRAIGLSVVTEDGWVSDPVWWGPGVDLPPLVGRPFRHGPSASDGKGDCYALIKDFHEIERDVKLPEFPRDWEWWQTGNLYTDGFPKAGFRPIPSEEILPGDVFLASIRASVPNHGGIYWGNGFILHHLVDRLSRREAASPWARHITHWLRYEGDLSPWSPS